MRAPGSALQGPLIAKMDDFEILYDGRGGIPGLCWKLKEGVDHGFTLFDLVGGSFKHSWISRSSFRPGRTIDRIG